VTGFEFSVHRQLAASPAAPIQLQLPMNDEEQKRMDMRLIAFDGFGWMIAVQDGVV